MKVSELIKKLSGLDGDLPVIMSRDPEGNGFSKLASDGITVYMADVTDNFIDEVKICEITDQHRKIGYTDEDVGDPETMTKCLVLWP